jgi:ribosomal protein S12 methylthiotransferase
LKTKPADTSIAIITLGCHKNLVDSEVLMRQLQAANIEVYHNPENITSATVIVNTCGFIADAKEESVNTILDFVRAKNEGHIRRLLVMGCLSQRYRSELQTEIPEADHLFGVDELPQLLASIGVDYKKELIGERAITTPAHYAYLKISEGCDRMCAFCAIPGIRGKHRSKPIGALVKEAGYLAEKGVKELIVIAQDTTYYGLDIYKKRRLAELLSALTKVEGIQWIRLHYTYPAGFPKDVLDVIASSPKLCKYIDIPVQHISDPLLRSMHRGHTGDQTRKLIGEIRSSIPDVAIRTSIITGFPGETDQHFAELEKFVIETKFDRLGVFTYSHEENTTAFKLDDNVPERIKRRRAARLMEIQEGISLQKNNERIGSVMKVIVDRREGDFWIGRSEFDSPEVDNEILIPATFKLKRGDFYQVRITGAEPFDLYAEPL